MMGTGTFAEPTFEAILANPHGHQVVGLVTQPDRAVGQERGSTRQTGKGMKKLNNNSAPIEFIVQIPPSTREWWRLQHLLERVLYCASQTEDPLLVC